MKMTTVLSNSAVLLALSLAAAGCGEAAVAPRSALETPESFLELDQLEYSEYVYRAASADGVVVGLREIPNERRGSLGFWSDAIRNQLRDGGAYALLDERDVTGQGGLRGRQLRFGRDQAGHPFRYWVTLFVRNEGDAPWLWIIEAGGEQETFDQHQDAVSALIASFAPTPTHTTTPVP
jgi:hypothetical protein